MDWNHTTYIASERYLFGFKVDRVLRQSQQSLKCTYSAAVPLCFKKHRGEGRRQNRKLLFTTICYYCPPQTCALSMTLMPDSLSHMTGIFFAVHDAPSYLVVEFRLWMDSFSVFFFFFFFTIEVQLVHSFMVITILQSIMYFYSYKYWIVCIP